MTPPNPLIPIAIEKVPSNLDGLVLKEYVPLSRLVALLKSEKLLESWDVTKYAHLQAQKNYTNEKEQLNAYMKKLHNNTVEVSYKKAKHGWGRPFIYKSLGFTASRSAVRNTLMKENYFIADLSNAQPTILQNICRANNIRCPCIDMYVMNRDSHLAEVMMAFNVDRKCAKKLFLRLCFFWNS